MQQPKRQIPENWLRTYHELEIDKPTPRFGNPQTAVHLQVAASSDASKEVMIEETKEPETVDGKLNSIQNDQQ